MAAAPVCQTQGSWTSQSLYGDTSLQLVVDKLITGLRKTMATDMEDALHEAG